MVVGLRQAVRCVWGHRPLIKPVLFVNHLFLPYVYILNEICI